MGLAVSFFSSYVRLAVSIFSQSYLAVLIFWKAVFPLEGKGHHDDDE